MTRLASHANCQLWRVDLETEPSLQAIDHLSASEHARAARFVFARDRRRFLAAHCALRQLLSDHTGTPDVALEFREGPFGKPYLSGAPSCSFNLSRSGDLALLALADTGEIGVDVELVRAIPDAAALADQHFSLAERAAFRRTSALDRDLALLLGWTRKEACLKAIGVGLNVAPHTFETGLKPDARVVSINTREGTVTVKVESICIGPVIVASLAHVLPETSA